MVFAGTVTSSALLPLLFFLWAEGQPLMPKNGSVVSVGNNVAAAPMCYYPSKSVGGGGGEPETVIHKAPLDAAAAVLLLPERAPAAGVHPLEGKEGLSWRAKAWCCWVLAVTLTIVVFLVRPETFLVSPLMIKINPMFADDISEDRRTDGDLPTSPQLSSQQHRDTDLVRPGPADDDDEERLYCAICMETVPGALKFSVGSCGHAFCSGCVAQYVAAKLVDNLARVECPDPACGGAGAVQPESCAGIISTDLLDKWGLLLCESALGANKVYCPYRECSAPLLADDGEAIAEAECPHCHRLFCARCAAPWHHGVGCSEFQQLGQDERGRDDLLLRRLAGQQRWQRCPRCHMYVEKSEGCNYIKCRCGYSFCYRCASKVSAETHYCNNCKR